MQTFQAGRLAAATTILFSFLNLTGEARPLDAVRAHAGRIEARAAALPASLGRSPYDGLIARHAQANGVPLGLAHAVIAYESQYRADAVGNSGEIGLMQILPATARGLGFSGDSTALHDPDTNLRFGMKYLGQAFKLGGGDLCGTILRYNAGLGATRMTAHASKYCGEVKRKLATP
jgi:soluble lytic murein transglycosylase-like protein